MPAKLYVIPASHPCVCVEAALALKGIEYERVDLVPVASKLVQQARFGGQTVPGLRFEDGERVLGSRPIVRALEERVPFPRLLPRDPEERRRVEEAERWGDEVLQPLARRLVWAGLRRAPGALIDYGRGARVGIPVALQRLSAPLVARAAQRFNGADDASVRADLVNLEWHLNRVEGWIDDGAIGGAEPNAADLQVGAGLRLLLTLEDIGPRLDGRPAGALARRWFPDYPGRLPAGTLPAAWLAARAPART